MRLAHKRIVGSPLLFALLGIVSSLFFSAPLCVHAQSTTALQAVLYVINTKKSIASLRAHIESRDIVAPQTYTVKPNGVLLGQPNAEILTIAGAAGAKVMPLVSNQNFNQKGVDRFLKSPKAENALITALIAEAQKRKYIGYQYDFEHMPASDRDLYSAFVEKSAPLFHTANLTLSLAVAPLDTDNPLAYGPDSWQNWTGAFDYKALGAAADFVSVMAYDDSRSVGPAASFPWVEGVLTYALARIPAYKISLGIPAYAWIWNDSTNKRVSVQGYPAIAAILAAHWYVAEGRSDVLGVSYVTYWERGREYTAWYEDGQSFQQKITLAQTNRLVGYSFWALGLESPDIWNVK